MWAVQKMAYLRSLNILFDDLLWSYSKNKWEQHLFVGFALIMHPFYFIYVGYAPNMLFMSIKYIVLSPIVNLCWKEVAITLILLALNWLCSVLNIIYVCYALNKAFMFLGYIVLVLVVKLFSNTSSNNTYFVRFALNVQCFDIHYMSYASNKLFVFIEYIV